MLENLIPIVAIVMVFGIPIVAILTAHQRKMAELFHSRNAQPQYNPEIAALREEVRELKQLIHQQAITMDNLVQTRVTPPPSIQDRINSGVG